jgi:hypothetical protein
MVFANNVSPFSFNVSLRRILFADNVVPNPALFASQGDYVCRPLQVRSIYFKFAPGLEWSPNLPTAQAY